MFCTELQFSSFNNILIEEVEKMDDGSSSHSDSKPTRSDKKKALFDAESVPLQYTRAVGT